MIRDFRDDGDAGQPGSPLLRQADLDEAIRRLVWLVRVHRPDVMTHYNEFGATATTTTVRAHQVAIGAFYRAGDPEWYPGQVAPEHGGSGPAAADGGLEPWAPAKLYEQAISRSRREAMAARAEAAGMTSWWSRPTEASPRSWHSWDEFMRRSTVDDSEITTRVDVRAQADQRWAALLAHRTQISLHRQPPDGARQGRAGRPVGRGDLHPPRLARPAGRGAPRDGPLRRPRLRADGSTHGWACGGPAGIIVPRYGSWRDDLESARPPAPLVGCHQAVRAAQRGGWPKRQTRGDPGTGTTGTRASESAGGLPKSRRLVCLTAAVLRRAPARLCHRGDRIRGHRVGTSLLARAGSSPHRVPRRSVPSGSRDRPEARGGASPCHRRGPRSGPRGGHGRRRLSGGTGSPGRRRLPGGCRP